MFGRLSQKGNSLCKTIQGLSISNNLNLLIAIKNKPYIKFDLNPILVRYTSSSNFINEKNNEKFRYNNMNIIVNNDLEHIIKEVKQLLITESIELDNLIKYYFDGSGKSLRPIIICSMARCINMYLKKKTHEEIKNNQKQIAMIAEMIHVASLIHDDIIDNSNLRRGKESINTKWGCNKAVFAGDFILATAARSLAKIGNTRVIETLAIVLDDLVQGELMQLGAKEYENERFSHYLTKTYQKTASLIANSCKAVAILSSEVLDENIIDVCFEYGKNIGIAFQLIDDLLDFTSNGEKLGKPSTGNDLKLGLATAPVLFAAYEYPELNSMIMRRFCEQDDAKKAFEFVRKSSGMSQTKHLALKYCENAMKILDKLGQNDATTYLKYLTKTIVNRDK